MSEANPEQATNAPTAAAATKGEKSIDTSSRSKSSLASRRASQRGSMLGLGPRLSSVRLGPTCPVNLDKITSDVFSTQFPPMDWADLGLLIPHEAIRRQMSMMVQSVSAMPDDPSENELWKATLFAKWYIEYFFISIEEHHDAEEQIYFPWIKSKTAYPEKEFGKSHEELLADMKEMKQACETIVKKGGKSCTKEITLLKTKAPAFEKEMRTHLKEEEESIPSILRNNFTQEEEGEIVEKILQAGGLEMTKKFLPAVLLAMQEWAKDDFYNQFVGSMPPPIKHLAFKYYLPDFENLVSQMRDAPTLEKKPSLKKTGCCGIPFCFPCIL